MTIQSREEFEAYLRSQVAQGFMTPEEAAHREKSWLDQQSEDYHLREGGLFADPARRYGKKVYVGSEEEAALPVIVAPDGTSLADPNASAADVRQRLRRPVVLQKAVEEALTNRVTDFASSGVLKVSLDEFRRMYADPEFVKFSDYAQDILFLRGPDGNLTNTPRPRPLRAFYQNEVGMWRGKYVVLKDAGPDDVGEGKYHTPGVQLERSTDVEYPEPAVSLRDESLAFEAPEGGE